VDVRTKLGVPLKRDFPFFAARLYIPMPLRCSSRPRACPSARPVRLRCAASVGAAPPPPQPEPQQRSAWPVTLRMSVRVRQAAPQTPCRLADYMSLPSEHYTLLPLPLGATLARTPGTAPEEGLFSLTIPSVRLFQLDVRPTICVRVAVLPLDEPCVRISVLRSRVDGGWAERLGLNQLFRITGDTELTWPGGEEMASETELLVGVDPPPPFAQLPRALLVAVVRHAVAAAPLLTPRAGRGSPECGVRAVAARLPSLARSRLQKLGGRPGEQGCQGERLGEGRTRFMRWWRASGELALAWLQHPFMQAHAMCSRALNFNNTGPCMRVIKSS